MFLASTPDRDDDFAAARGFVLHCDDRGLIEHDAALAHVDQRVGGSKIDREVIGEITSKAFEHGVFLGAKGGEKSCANVTTDTTFSKATCIIACAYFLRTRAHFCTHMSLTRQDVEKIAHLARLSITEAEMPVYVSSLSSIVDFVDELSRVETGGVEPMAHPLDGQRQRLRADAVTETDQHEKYQRNAPSVQAGLYVVPRVIE